MILPVVKYGHPVLRQKGARIEKVTPEIKKLIANMFETMYDASGIGLAAQQVGEPLQLCLIDVREVEDRPSTLELNGKPADVKKFMPLVLINPQLTPSGESVEGSEGCLSFPEVFTKISRPQILDVQATNEKGETLKFRCGGLLSRVIQHEVDHLNGILFIDRMTRKQKAEFRDELDVLQAQTKAELKAAQKA